MTRQIVLLGPPASGKGTQGRLLSERAGLAYFGTGKQLRKELDGGTDLGREIAPLLAEGRYVPDGLVLALVLDWLKTAEDGWVLDGFPRTLPQARDLDTHLGPESERLAAVLIEVPDEELERRILERRECTECSWTGTRAAAETSGRCPACGGGLRQREDDELSNFRQRLASYRELTEPVGDYYDSAARLGRVSGSGSPEEVFGRICEQFGLE